MAKQQFAFIGDPKAPGQDPPVAELYGLKFPFGEMVEVDEASARKLETNSHYSNDSAKIAEAKKAKEEYEKTEEKKRGDDILLRAKHEYEHPSVRHAPTVEEPGAAGAAVTAEADEKEALRIIEETNGNPSSLAQSRAQKAAMLEDAGDGAKSKKGKKADLDEKHVA